MSILRHFKGFWRFHGLIVASICASVLTLGCAVKEPAFFEGTWVVTNVYQPETIKLNRAEVEGILGSSFVYHNDTAHLNQQQCVSPRYEKRKMNHAEVAQQYNVKANALGFDDRHITQVVLTCGNNTQGLGSVLLFQEHTTAYTVYNGVFYRIEKTL